MDSPIDMMKYGHTMSYIEKQEEMNRTLREEYEKLVALLNQ